MAKSLPLATLVDEVSCGVQRTIRDSPGDVCCRNDRRDVHLHQGLMDVT